MLLRSSICKILVGLIFPLVLFSQIHQIRKLNELLPYVQKDTLVIFDVDNTLIEPLQTLGSDQWFDNRIKFYQKKGLSAKSAFEKTYDEYYQIQSITDARAVEPDTWQVFAKTLKKAPVMGLTTRDICLSYVTFKQLKKLNLIFSKPPVKKELYVYTDRGLLYKNGIFYTAGAHKGKAFMEFIKKALIQKPKKVLFINDKLKPLKELEEECTKNKIDFTGLRYGYLDKKVKNLNLKLLEKKLPSFANIVLKISRLQEGTKIIAEK